LGTLPWFTPFEAGDYYTLYAVPEEFSAHRAVTAEVCKAIMAKQGGGNIVGVTGVEGNSTDLIRSRGRNDALNDYPKIKLAGELPGKWIAGFDGMLAVVRLGAAGPALGQDLLLNSLAAIVVGGTSLSGGVGGPDRTLLGVLIITMLDNGLNLLGVSSYPQLVIKGAVVIVAVLISQNRGRTLLVK
jgi:hypothetical protein